MKDLRRIETNQRHLVRLLNDLLDLAKLESGQMPVNLTECGIIEILESARPMFEPQLSAKGIAYQHEIEESTPSVIGDPDRVQQILINLIANSIKFTPPKGSIRISANRRKDDVDVRISDSGPGIPTDRAATLFSPFVQLGDQHSGTGLGLAISRELLEIFFKELIPLMQEGRFKYGMTVTLPPDLQLEPWMRNWVYRRRGHPCFVCAMPIEMFRQGDFQRMTYFCPHCQPTISRPTNGRIDGSRSSY